MSYLVKQAKPLARNMWKNVVQLGHIFIQYAEQNTDKSIVDLDRFWDKELDMDISTITYCRNAALLVDGYNCVTDRGIIKIGADKAQLLFLYRNLLDDESKMGRAFQKAQKITVASLRQWLKDKFSPTRSRSSLDGMQSRLYFTGPHRPESARRTHELVSAADRGGLSEPEFVCQNLITLLGG